MSRRILLSSSLTKLMATPFLPNRPPRPILLEKKRHHVTKQKTGQSCSLSVSNPSVKPVDVILPVGGQIVVDNQRHLLHVNATGLQTNKHTHTHTPQLSCNTHNSVHVKSESSALWFEATLPYNARPAQLKGSYKRLRFVKQSLFKGGVLSKV